MRIRTLLMLLFIITGLIPFATAGLYGLNFTENALKGMIGQGIAESASVAALSIQEELEGKILMLSAFANDAKGIPSSGELEGELQFLDGLYGYPVFRELIATDNQGMVLNRAGTPINIPDGWMEVAKEKDYYVGGPYYDSNSNSYSVDVAVKIGESGLLKGALDLRYLYMKIMEIRSQIGADEIILIDSGGEIIISSESGFLRFGTKPAMEKINHILSVKKGYVVTGFGGRDYLVGFSDIPRNRFVDTGWSVLVMDDANAAYGSVSRIANAVYFSAGIILVFLLIVAVIFSRIISKPIERITKTIKAISMGNLAVKLEKADEIREIGDLNEALKRVIASLKLAVKRVKKKGK